MSALLCGESGEAGESGRRAAPRRGARRAPGFLTSCLYTHGAPSAPRCSATEERTLRHRVPPLLPRPVHGAVAASITQTISIYLDANVISPQRSFWNNSHRNCLYTLNEKCADFSEWGLNYSPTTCGSALFTLFIKQGEKKAMQSITKQLPERLLQTCCPGLKGRLPLIWAELAHGPPAITQRGVLVPVAPTYLPSFLAGFEGSSPGTTPHPRYVPFTPFSQPFCHFHHPSVPG